MDKLRAMELLLSVAETRSFSETGRRQNMSTASVSRRLSELEDVLGATLIHRSTRNLTLSEAGNAYAVRAREILFAVGQADAGVTALQGSPYGVLRLHSRTMFGLKVLTPLQAGFSRKYPDLMVELHLSERPARLREDGFDIDFRIAPPQENGLMRRRLFLSDRVLVAAPEYLRDHGAPASPEDLRDHNCLVYWLGADPPYWRFQKDERTQEIRVRSGFSTNNGQVLLEAAKSGLGLALLDDYTVAEDLASGRLVRVLKEYRITNTSFEDGIYATFLETVQVPAKIRVFLDYLTENMSSRLG